MNLPQLFCGKYICMPFMCLIKSSSPEAGRTYVGPTGHCWGSGSLGKVPAACPSDSKLSGCSSPDLDEQKERNNKAADILDQHHVAGSFTFCANSGFPESLLRCMNSKCRVPYSARMLLPPDAHGQFLPIPLKKRQEDRC